VPTIVELRIGQQVSKTVANKVLSLRQRTVWYRQKAILVL